MLANAALLVASLLESVPPALCAATGLDALDHALESIWNKNSTPLTRAISRQAAIEVLETLPLLYKAERNKQPLIERMLKASTKAGIAFNLTGTAAGHAISFVLSEEWNVPHGMACAFTLLEVFNWARKDKNTAHELAIIGKHFYADLDGEKAVDALYEQLKTLMADLAIPTTFEALGLSSVEPSLFDRAMDDPKLLNQLPPLSKENLHLLIKAKS